MRLFKPAIILFLAIAIGHLFLKNMFYHPVDSVQYGVTFSPKYASQLKLDWQETYLKMLDDLKVKNLRIPTPWDELEKKTGEVDFSAIDFMVKEASQRGVKLVLVLGIRQPRWPECHIPAWAESLNPEEKRQKILQIIQQVVERYKEQDAIWAWQIENEPTFDAFGICDKFDAAFLKKEIEVVRGLSFKKIIITDSGEWGSWVLPMQLSDIFGTTVYRDVYHPLFGLIRYPFPAYLYPIRSRLLKNIFAPKNEKTIIIELQAEPWLPNGNASMTSIDEQSTLFPIHQFESNVLFAKQTGFDTVYLWGVEWWYWMAKQGHPEYLDYAKILF